jgi:GMP synthase-like glutamine amidotransferase
MRLAILQHVPFEGPAAIAEWAKSRGAEIVTYHIYNGDVAPAHNTFDFLVIMGGPMSVNDTGTLQWLAPEIAAVRDAIDAGKIVLGVCLGAQMIAKALGGRVYPGPEKEIGWFEVKRTEVEGATLFSSLPWRFLAFHWHGEVFDLPAGAVRLAETEVTPNQAFQIGDRVLGLQFHMESTRESVFELAENCAHEIGQGRFQMTQQEILGGGVTCHTLHPLLEDVLDRLTGLRPAAD